MHWFLKPGCLPVPSRRLGEKKKFCYTHSEKTNPYNKNMGLLSLVVRVHNGVWCAEFFLKNSKKRVEKKMSSKTACFPFCNGFVSFVFLEKMYLFLTARLNKSKAIRIYTLLRAFFSEGKNEHPSVSFFLLKKWVEKKVEKNDKIFYLKKKKMIYIF